MSILLSNICLVLPAVVKQQQEAISRNHIQSLFAISVYVHNIAVHNWIIFGCFEMEVSRFLYVTATVHLNIVVNAKCP